MSGTLDPALGWLLRLGLAVLFGAAALHKLRDPTAFRAALGDYELLPRWFVLPAAFLLPALEAAAAVGFCTGPLAAAAAYVAALLLALYGAAMAINLARGRRHIDCGCTGPAGRQALGLPLIARNAVLAAAALASALPLSPRPLVWVDGVTIVTGLAVLVLLYVALDGLLAHAPRIAVLRLLHPTARPEEPPLDTRPTGATRDERGGGVSKDSFRENRHPPIEEAAGA